MNPPKLWLTHTCLFTSVMLQLPDIWRVTTARQAVVAVGHTGSLYTALTVFACLFIFSSYLVTYQHRSSVTLDISDPCKHTPPRADWPQAQTTSLPVRTGGKAAKPLRWPSLLPSLEAKTSRASLTISHNLFHSTMFNLLAPEFYIEILAHSVWIIQEPKKVTLWNKRHFEEKSGECAACLKY
jgi:hypothetical protein